MQQLAWLDGKGDIAKQNPILFFSRQGMCR
jgi:hypothetical protein